MNYYPFHIGDYKAHTAYLTPMQDIAYRRLLDLYYLQERPLPGDPAACARQIGMREHLDDVRLVLEDYFHLEDGLYRNARCDRVLEDWSDKQEKSRRAGEASGRARTKRVKVSTDLLTELSTEVASETASAAPERPFNARSTDAQHLLNERSTDVEQALNQKGTPVEHPLNERSASVEQTFNTRSTDVEHPLNERSTNQKPITNNQRLNPPLSPLGRGEALRDSPDLDAKLPETPGGRGDRAGTASAAAAPAPVPAPPDGRMQLAGAVPDARAGAAAGAPSPPRHRLANPEDWAGIHVPRPGDVPDDLWRDFCALRKARSAPVTARALDGVRREASKAGASMAEALTFMVERGHQGFIVDAWARQTQGNGAAGRAGRLRGVMPTQASYSEGVREDGRIL